MAIDKRYQCSLLLRLWQTWLLEVRILSPPLAEEFDRVIAQIHESIKEYLGDDPRIDGGSIGEPIAQPEYALLCRDFLHNTIIKAGEMHYCPPLSRASTNIECLTDWIWICAVNGPDHDEGGHALATQ